MREGVEERGKDRGREWRREGERGIDLHLFSAVDFIIRDQQPTTPLVRVKVGKDGTPTDNQKLSVIVKR